MTSWRGADSEGAVGGRTVVFHADMDAFFTSIEQRDNPSLKGRPVVVGARPGTRGVVSAASYEARKFGVHSAMPVSAAHAKCPQAVFLRPRMEAYARESKTVMDIFRSFSPHVEPISIDEAFIDMTGTERLYGRPIQAARTIAGRVAAERGLSVSIGIAPNKFLAKLASDLNKPGGITEAPFEPEAIVPWLAPMPVSRIWGVGKKTLAMLQSAGIATIGDLQECPREKLEDRFGLYGGRMFELCRGIDEREFETGGGAKSISREHTFPADSADRAVWRRTLLSLARDVASQARAQGLAGRTVVFTWRLPDFSRHTRRVTMARPTCVARRIYGEALGLLEKTEKNLSALRLIGIGITGLDSALQTELFAARDPDLPWESSERAMDSIAEKFGRDTIMRAGEIMKDKKRPGRSYISRADLQK